MNALLPALSCGIAELGFLIPLRILLRRRAESGTGGFGCVRQIIRTLAFSLVRVALASVIWTLQKRRYHGLRNSVAPMRQLVHQGFPVFIIKMPSQYRSKAPVSVVVIPCISENIVARLEPRLGIQRSIFAPRT